MNAPRSASRYLRLSALLFTAGCHPVETRIQAAPPPERLVAEAVIVAGSLGATDRAGHISKFVFLPITVHGQLLSLLLDLGAPGGLFGGAFAGTSMEIGLPAADVVRDNDGHRYVATLPFGTDTASHVRIMGDENGGGAVGVDAPYDLPPMVGTIGTSVLSQYDLLFDGPAGRVRIYKPTTPSSSAPRSPRWLPPGLTSSACFPMTVDTSMGPNGVPAYTVWFPVSVNGHHFLSLFDSGSESTNMELGVVQRIGLSPASPNMHPFTGEVHLMGDSARWEATDLALTLGTQPLTRAPVLVFEHIDPWGASVRGGQPMINLGLHAVQDRLLFISYSTRTVCISKPQ